MLFLRELFLKFFQVVWIQKGKVSSKWSAHSPTALLFSFGFFAVIAVFLGRGFLGLPLLGALSDVAPEVRGEGDDYTGHVVTPCAVSWGVRCQAVVEQLDGEKYTFWYVFFMAPVITTRQKSNNNYIFSHLIKTI